MALSRKAFIPLILFLQSIEGDNTWCQLDYEGDHISKITLFSPEAVGKIPLDLFYKASGTNDEEKVVMCDWVAGKCMTNKDFKDSRTGDILSIQIISSSYCRHCGEFHFEIKPNKIIKCKDLYQTTTKQSSTGSACNSKGVRARTVVGISFLTLLTKGYF